MTQVLAEVSVNLAHFDRMHMREEWDSLREHDVVFLVSIQSPNVSLESCNDREGSKVGKTAVRGFCLGIPCICCISLMMWYNR